MPGLSTDVTDDVSLANRSDTKTGIDEISETSERNNEPYIINEVTSLREEDSKHYRMSDGSMTKAIFPGSIHFQENGQWMDIDNRLLLAYTDDDIVSGKKEAALSQSEKGSFDITKPIEYKNRANIFSLRLTKNADQNSMVSLTEDRYKVSFTALYDPADYLLQWSAEEKAEARGTARSISSEVTDVQSDRSAKADPYDLGRTGSELTYKDVQPGVDFQYIPTNLGVKENIIVGSPQSGYEYAFALSLTGLNARLAEEGLIELYDEKDPTAVKYVFPAPYMYDGVGEESHAVKYELSEVSSFDELRGCLAPAIEAAGQEAVFAELDRANNLAENQKGAETVPTPEQGADRAVPDATVTATIPVAAETASETDIKTGSAQTFSEIRPVLEESAEEPPLEEGDNGTAPPEEGGEATLPEEGVEESPETGQPSEEQEEPPANEPELAEASSLGGALDEKLAEENLYIFTVKADKEWIDDGDRAFPVIIDPVLERLRPQELATGSYTLKCNEYNTSGILVGWHTTDWMHVGWTTTRTYYCKTDFTCTFPAGFADDIAISKAEIRIQGDSSNIAKKVVLTADAWDMNTGGYDTSIIDFDTIVASTTTTPNPITTFDITKLLAHKDLSTPMAFSFVPQVVSENTYRQFRFPLTGAFLTITYTLPGGLEDYWAVHSQSAGRAGTGYVNDYAGYLTFVHGDVSTPGTRMPAGVQHIYNSNVVTSGTANPLSYTDAGNGWKLNYQQTLTIPVGEADPSVYPYVWADGDGAKHFFESADVTIYENGDERTVTAAAGGAVDEDGLGLYVVPVSNPTLSAEYPLKITDMSGSTNMYFNKAGNLGLIMDSNQKEDGSNSATKEKNRIEIVYSPVAGKTMDDGSWNILLSDMQGYLSNSSVALLSDYEATLRFILQMELKDQFIRRDKAILAILDTVKATMVQLIENPSITKPMRETMLNEAITAINQAKPLIATCDQQASSRITKIKDAADITINVSYYIGGTALGKIYQITDPIHTGKFIDFDYDNSGNLIKIIYPLEAGALQRKASTYTYDTGKRMTSATESGGFKIDYTYGASGYNKNRVTGVSESDNNVSGQEFAISHYLGRTIYTFSGKDDVLRNSPSYPTATNDNVLTTYLFDPSGRTTTAYSTLATKQFLGGGSYEYVDASDSSNNKIKRVAENGSHTKNYLKNHSFEISGSDSNWLSYNNFAQGGSITPATAAFDNTDNFIGARNANVAGSASFSGGTTANPKISGYTQPLTLQAGDYTFSGYVKTSALSTGGEAFLRVVGQSQTDLINPNNSIGASETVGQNTTLNLNSGWVRCTVTFTLAQTTNIYACAEVRNATAGNAYFDCMQLEKGKVANAYNILENSSFEHDGGLAAPWAFNKGGSSSTMEGLAFGTGGMAFDGSRFFRIMGEIGKKKTLSTPLNVGPVEKDYVLSGWVKLTCVTPVKDGRELKVEITNGTTVEESKDLFIPIDYNKGMESVYVYFNMPVPRGNLNGYSLNFVVDNIAGFVDIDDLQLLRKDITTAEYDAGNLTVLTTGAEETTYTYTERGLVATETSPAGVVSTYTYDPVTNDVVSVDEESGTVITTISYTYDNFGNCNETATGDGTIAITTYDSYTSDGRFLDYTLDSRGNKTAYQYNTRTGLPTLVMVNGNTVCQIDTAYSYDDLERVTSVKTSQALGVGGKAVTYGYNGRGDLTTVTHNGFDYGISYDGFRNTAGVNVAGQQLGSFEYGPMNGKLKNVTYGNGFSTEYIYNDQEQVASEKWVQQGSAAYNAFEMLYNNEGQLAIYYDNMNNMKYSYDYDAAGRPRREFAWKNGVKQYEIEKEYKNGGQPLSLWYGICDGVSKTPVERKYVYTYEADGRVLQATLPNGSYSKPSYDTLKRVSSVMYNPISVTTNTKVFKTDLTYLAGSVPNLTTELVGTLSNKVSGVEVGRYTYDYNKIGYLSSVTDNKTNKTITYEYNELSYLTRENNQVLNKTITYDYNAGGNITVVKEYAYTMGAFGPVLATNSYVYPSSGWQDKLSSYNGQSIVYDSIGNPTTYRGKMLVWSYGRKLTSASWAGNSIEYSYGTSGGRLSKTVNGLKTTYTIVGGAVVQEKNSQYEINYYYGSEGDVVSLGYKTAGSASETYYALIRNLQGDVVAVYTSDANPALVGTYTYDSWGKVTATTLGSPTSDPNGIMAKNPLRYRGYYFDQETGFYYLQSRYYDPEVKRFINADGLVSTGQGVTGYNMFSYCLNNPVNRIDPTGYLSRTISIPDWGLNWRVTTTVTFTYQGGKNGKITYVSVSQNRRYGFPFYVSIEGTSWYSRYPNATTVNIVAYYRVSYSISFPYIIVKQSINLKGDGTYWSKTWFDLFGRVPYSYFF